MNLSPTTVVLWPGEPDPYTIRLRSLSVLTDFSVAATARVSTAATLRAGATFSAAPTVSIGTAPRLNVRSPLAASSTITISDSAALLMTPLLAARPGITVSTLAPLTIYPTLSSRSSVTISSTTPRLTLGGIPFRAQSTVTLSVAPPVLSRTAQYFSTAAEIHTRTNGNLQLIGYGATDAIVTFNGADRTPTVRVNTLQIADILNEAPNTASFVVDDRTGTGPPAIGTDVKIALGNLLSQNVIFGGTVKSTEQYYDLVPSHPAWRVSCDDYTFLINRRRVVGTWTNVSATQVALDILARFTTGFSSAGIAAGLPAVTVTFLGETVMDALTQIANLSGAYAGGPDYNRVVWLFITDPRPAPSPVTAGSSLLMLQNPVTRTLDVTQTRTRVLVKGKGTSVGGPADFTIGNEFGQVPLADSQIFTPGESGQIVSEDAQIVNYADVAPGKQASIVRGNVPAPIGAPVAQIATGKAGGLQGSGYQWKVAFGNQYGETEVGPASWPPLTAAAFPAPAAGFGLGVSNAQVGPLVGTYQYAVSFVTSLGETLLGPVQTITAPGIAAPGAPSLGEATAAGPLEVGKSYGYATSYLTIYGETLPSATSWYTPSGLPYAAIDSFSQWEYGGLENNADYRYGASIVTKYGEGPVVAMTIHTFSYNGTPPAPGVLNADFNGYIPPGNYTWAWSYYSDAFGESLLGGQTYASAGPPPPSSGAAGARILLSVPGLSSRADGLRLYRGRQGGNPWALVADLRRPVPYGSWWDGLAEGGNPWPVSPRRNGGAAVQFYVYATSAPDVIARRLYRSKANGTDLYLLAELQSNTGTYYFDSAFDDTLTQRNPAVPTTGRAAIIALPGNPGSPSYTGYVGRRVYRTKANAATFYRIADVKDMSSTYILDATADASLSSEGPATPATAGGQAHLLQSIPIGPAGTLARRIYRTVGNGQELRRLAELGDNTTTTYLDTVPDSALSTTLRPLVNNAGAAAVLLSQMPIGGPTVTQRLIYRTKAGGGPFLFVGSIPNNTDTTFLDTKADDDLGRIPVTVSTIGALAGDTAVVVQSATGWPTSGWFEADSQTIRYSGITFGQPGQGDTLTGIPPLLQVSSIGRSGQTAVATTIAAHGFTKVGQRVVILGADQPEYCGTRTITAISSATVFQYQVNGSPASPATAPAGKNIWTSAPGAITGAIAGGTTVMTVPMLTGTSGIGVPLDVGSNVALWVVCNSTAGQQALAAIEGGDGVHEYLVTDGALDSGAACRARGNAELLLFQYVQVAIDYVTRDTKTRSGAMVSIDLPAPTGISGSFRISEVRIDQIDVANRLAPRFTVHCSNTKFSLMDLLRHVVLSQDHAA